MFTVCDTWHTSVGYLSDCDCVRWLSQLNAISCCAVYRVSDSKSEDVISRSSCKCRSEACRQGTVGSQRWCSQTGARTGSQSSTAGQGHQQVQLSRWITSQVWLFPFLCQSVFVSLYQEVCRRVVLRINKDKTKSYRYLGSLCLWKQEFTYTWSLLSATGSNDKDAKARLEKLYQL